MRFSIPYFTPWPLQAPTSGSSSLHQTRSLTPLGLSQFRLLVDNEPRPLVLMALNSSASQYSLHHSRSSSNPRSSMKTF